MNTEKRIEILKKYYRDAFSESDTLGFRLINAMQEYAEYYSKQLHKPDVGGPASASALEGEQLGNEAGGKSVWEGCECDEDWGHDAELKCFKCGKIYRD